MGPRERKDEGVTMHGTSFHDNYKKNSVELCRDIIQEKDIEHCRDIILRATTKLEDKYSYNVAT